MGTAKIKISQVLLFELLGLSHFDGRIDSFCFNENSIELDIIGNDERLPDSQEYPECNLIVKTIQTHFEKF